MFPSVVVARVPLLTGVVVAGVPLLTGVVVVGVLVLPTIVDAHTPALLVSVYACLCW